VEEVRFQGARTATHASLRHIADVRNGEFAWRVDGEEVAQRVQEHPWVRAAHAEVFWDGSVLISVEEHRPVAIVHYGSAHYVSELGVVFLEADSSAVDLPHITGITPQLANLHPELPGQALATVLQLLELLDARGVLDPAHISEIAFSRNRGLTVHLKNTRVVFGVPGLERQVRRLALLMEEGTLDTAVPTFVDLAPETVAIVRPLSIGNEG
jgi:cell division septal protein FtsQ